MLRQRLLVVSTPTDSEMKASTQIESIVNSLDLALNRNLIHEWELLVFPSSKELIPTTQNSINSESKTFQSTGPLIDPSELTNPEGTKAILLDRITQGNIFLVCSQGIVFAPNTVSELLKSLDETSDVFWTQNFPLNVGNGMQPVTSVLLASERVIKAFIELFDSYFSELSISRIINQLSSNNLFSSSNVPSAKSFDTEYSFEKSKHENA